MRVDGSTLRVDAERTWELMKVHESWLEVHDSWWTYMRVDWKYMRVDWKYMIVDESTW